ncbi:UNVERIFIED_CONTAM: hypothetical protein GTU68_051944 [Idotea baltica]|nr:hypothetical protein [Idotea baltica]
MTQGKKICCGIMLCQMTAILSGCAMLYLAVIVVIPARDELASGYHREPIMCTTVKAEDITAGGKKVECDWSTCGEWCLSKSSTPCMQIYVMARQNGSAVTFSDCYDIEDLPCSALDVNLTLVKKCKLGECRELNGLYNCTKDGDNPCRDITPAYHCERRSALKGEAILCNEEKCEERLNGVYLCKEGGCHHLSHIRHYWKDCTRKCSNLRLSDVNVVIFSTERLITTKCTHVHSNDNNSISDLNYMSDWKQKKKVLFIYCTYYYKTNGVKAYDAHTGDCFNATLGDAAKIANITNFLDILEYARHLHNQSDFLIEAEESLRLMNTTKLTINPEGCVNSLKKECKSFFNTHATDGRDGKTQDRFPCYYTESNAGTVIGKFNPDLTYMYMMLASVMPASLFVFACLCLFICSKSVGVDDDGHLKVTLLQSSNTGGNMQNTIILKIEVIYIV